MQLEGCLAIIKLSGGRIYLSSIQGEHPMADIQSHIGQSWPLPQSLEDLIPYDHICFLIEGLIDALDHS